MLVQLVYISRPVSEVRAEVNSSLPDNQQRNKERNISGMIISHREFYLQVFEGERDMVNKLFRKVACDKRHTDVTVLRYTEVRRSEFPHWDFTVIEDCADDGFHEYIDDVVTLNPDFIRDVTSSAAMGILRRAFMIAVTKKAPNRRATDVRELPQLSR